MKTSVGNPGLWMFWTGRSVVQRLGSYWMLESSLYFDMQHQTSKTLNRQPLNISPQPSKYHPKKPPKTLQKPSITLQNPPKPSKTTLRNPSKNSSKSKHHRHQSTPLHSTAGLRIFLRAATIDVAQRGTACAQPGVARDGDQSAVEHVKLPWEGLFLCEFWCFFDGSKSGFLWFFYELPWDGFWFLVAFHWFSMVFLSCTQKKKGVLGFQKPLLLKV